MTGLSRSSSSRLRSSRSLIRPIACSAESSTSNAARGTVAGSFFRTSISAQPKTAASAFRSSWFTIAKNRSRARWSCCTSSSRRALSSCSRAFSTAAAVLAASSTAMCSSSSVNACGTDLLGQVQIAEHAAAPDDRHAEKGVHRRMVRRKSVGVGVLVRSGRRIGRGPGSPGRGSRGRAAAARCARAARR